MFGLTDSGRLTIDIKKRPQPDFGSTNCYVAIADVSAMTKRQRGIPQNLLWRIPRWFGSVLDQIVCCQKRK